MSLPEASTNHRLQYLRDAGFFSARRAEKAALQFVGADLARETLAFTRLSMRWAPGGSLTADVSITGMPLPPCRPPSRCGSTTVLSYHSPCIMCTLYVPRYPLPLPWPTTSVWHLACLSCHSSASHALKHAVMHETYSDEIHSDA